MKTLLSHAAVQVIRVLPRQKITRIFGRLADHAWSEPVGRAVIRLYTRAYGVEFDECEERSWSSFDAFFTRKLRSGARPIDRAPFTLVSPADGRIECISSIDSQNTTFRVKHTPYKVADLLGDEEEARRYEGGIGCVIYLSPRDYHRVHAPLEGTINTIYSWAGDYYPVNALGVRSTKNLLARNRRVVLPIDTPEGSPFGRVTVVMVAAMIVGRITVEGIESTDVPFGMHRLTPPMEVERGQELGAFHLGSTVVLLVERSHRNQWVATEGPIRWGNALVRGSGVEGEAG